jgi:S1-C subfamily serine protease
MPETPDRNGAATPANRRPWLPCAAGGAVGVLIGLVALAAAGAFHTAGSGLSAAVGGQSGAAVGIPVQNTAAPAVPGAAGGPPAPAGTAPKLDIRSVLRSVEPGVVDITDYGGGATPSATGEGTGMILDPQGDVLTNAHVVAGGSNYSVRPAGQSTVYSAKVVASDTVDDVAVIRIQNPGALTPVPLGTSDTVQVGDPVVAVGNALGLQPGGPTVSQGIVSAVNRRLVTDNGNGGSETLTGLIQTDAPINPGNSGGPLIDASGHVIGVTTAVSTDGQNIGFVIPINRIAPLLPALEAGTVPPSSQPFLGVKLETAAAGGGAAIITVTAGSPARTAGLQVGDIITAVNGAPVESSDDVVADVSLYDAGTPITVTYTRAGVSHTVTITLASRTAP